MFQNRRNNGSPYGKGQDYWQSYSDMMAALVLIFILIMSAILFNSIEKLKKQETQLKEQEVQISIREDQQKQNEEKLKENEEKLKELNEKLETVIGIKAEIIDKLKDSFSQQGVNIDIDPSTGAIAFDADICFRVGSSELTQDGLQILREIMPLYLGVLLGDEYGFRDSIAEIIIEGHTDSTGNYFDNMRLSSSRALSVARACLSKQTALDTQIIDELRGLLSYNGKGQEGLVLDSVGKEDADASRRVVIKFRLKDDEMIREMQEMLESKLLDTGAIS